MESIRRDDQIINKIPRRPSYKAMVEEETVSMNDLFDEAMHPFFSIPFERQVKIVENVGLHVDHRNNLFYNGKKIGRPSRKGMIFADGVSDKIKQMAREYPPMLAEIGRRADEYKKRKTIQEQLFGKEPHGHESA